MSERTVAAHASATRQRETVAPVSTLAGRPLQRTCACGGAPGLDGACAACRARRLARHRSLAEAAGPVTTPPVVHELRQAAGWPLDPAPRADREPRFGHAFSRVRVHPDARAGGDDATGAPARAGAALVQCAAADEAAAPAPRGGPPPYRQDVLEERPRRTPPRTETPTPPVCDPNRPLTWADFRGAPPAGSPWAAMTGYYHDLVTQYGWRVIRALFVPGSSWVQPQYADPTNRAVTGCATQIGECEQFFATVAAGRPGATASLAPQTRRCQATTLPNPAVLARSRGECASRLGAECDRVARLESARLLRHEQLHHDIACVLARKGTDALLSRPENQAQDILTAVKDKASTAQNQYDAQTGNGCNPAPQAAWESAVGNRLPAVTIP